jgi:alpha-tubulin suppressor-like RCC1 family protein
MLKKLFLNLKNHESIKTFISLVVLLMFHTLNAEAQIWKEVSTSRSILPHTMAIRNDGTLWAWGRNNDSQLGDGTKIDRVAPIQIGNDLNWRHVSTGNNHTLAIKTDGTLWAWGINGIKFNVIEGGNLGDGTSINRNTPVRIGIDTDWESVSAGGIKNIALKRDGSIWAWGRGPLGDNTVNHSYSPIRIGIDNNWTQFSVGQAHIAAIKTDGTLWTWGSNDVGQLGDGSTIQRLIPVQIGTLNNWVTVSSGTNHTMAIRRDGTLWAWGWNINGQLGDGTTTNRNSPVQIGTANNWIVVSAGESHTSAVRSDGTIWAWGYGLLGDGTTANRINPVQIGTASDWVIISSGGSNSAFGSAGTAYLAGIRADGSLWTWGSNERGQLGDATQTARDSPVRVMILSAIEMERAQARAKAEENSRNEANLLYQKSVASFNKNDYDRAIIDLSEAIRLNPDRDNFYDLRGRAYYNKQDYNRSVADLSQAIRINSNNSSYYQWRGYAYYYLKNFEQALSDFEIGLRLSPNNDNVRQWLDATRQALRR